MYHQNYYRANCAPSQNQKRNMHRGYPKVNIQKNENGYDLFIAVPGFDKKDLTMQMDKNILKISGQPAAAENESYQFQGFRVKPFNLSYELGENMEIANISASHSNGILNVHIPFQEKTPAQNINIQ